MFNLFKSEKAIIAEIHKSFDTAQDKLLKEANDIINKSGNIGSKAALAESIGFVNIPVVKNNKALVKTKEEADLINYYKFNYPFQKFLTEDLLDQICTKYNLIYAPIKNYIEDVPEKNVKEISIATPLKPCDMIDRVARFSKNGHPGSETMFLQILNKKEPIFSETELKDLVRKYYAKDESTVNYYGSFDNKNFSTAFYVLSQGMQSVGMVNTISYSVRKEIEKGGLFIAAPQSHFDTKGLSKHNKFGFLNISIVEVKDPIVFRYCRGGIQVLSKWGLEASDELVVNEIEN